MHISFGPLFHDKNNEAQRKVVQENLDRYDAWLKGTFVLGESFSAADCYTLVFTGWAWIFGSRLARRCVLRRRRC